MDGFDACTREVTDCLRSHNITVSAELYAGLLSHLATCRRRLLLARSRDHQHATVLPSAECSRLYSDSPDENCLQTTKVARQMQAVAGEVIRSPLLSIANVQSTDRSATETGVKAKPQLSCTNVINSERTSEHSIEQTFRGGINVGLSAALQSDISRSQRTDSCTSRDVIGEADYHGMLSLATDDNVTSLMWRPW